MFKKGSKLYSIFNWKCPRCHEGDLFKTGVGGGIYNMHKECPKCKQDFEMEPGFYWGAMYVGYALSAGYMLVGFAVCLWVLGLTANQSFALLIFLGIIFMPFTARFARALWINTNVHYNKRIAEEVSQLFPPSEQPKEEK